MNFIGRIGNTYKRLLCKHPYLINSIQTGLLMGTGDVIAQKMIEKRCKLDYSRTAQVFTMGTVVVGPALTMWYKFLTKQFGSCGLSTAFKKMALDQLIFAPAFLALLIAGLSILKERSFNCAGNELCDKYTNSLFSNYTIWPAVQLGNFYYIPLAFQVLVVQIVALIYNSYLSWKTPKDIDED